MSYLFPRLAYAPVRCGPVRHEFGSLFSLFDDTARELQRNNRQTRRTFIPRFDVTENKDAFLLEGEVPGFQESDLSIEWNDNTLAVSGRHENVTEPAQQPETTETPAVDNGSETSSVRSHQPTVEDEEVEGESSAAQVFQPTEAQAPAESRPAKPEVQRLISERRSGQFLRQFEFPSNAVNHEDIRASLQSGILKIVVPKAEPQASRRINIQ